MTESIPTPEEAFRSAILADERRRVCQIIESHKSHLETVYVRLINLVNSGVDLDEEMKLPPEERAGGFHWPDEE